MVGGVVLVRLKAGKEKQALEKIRKIPGVSHVTGVFGRWDLIVDVEASTLQELTDLVVGEIRAIDGVENTETLLTTAL
ncbi:MAG: Lrp/AsnC ligand binding domain-containing protein [bacterium]|nr:Lrp/AsnC ligand binding domain-containing protein [bacterium]